MNAVSDRKINLMNAFNASHITDLDAVIALSTHLTTKRREPSCLTSSLIFDLLSLCYVANILPALVDVLRIFFLKP